MATRAAWVLLTLVALFSMHGLSVVSPPVSASPEPTLELQYASTAMASTTEAADDHAGRGSGAAGTVGDDRSAPEMQEHGAVAHVWALCLAVLLAGIAGFRLAVLARRKRSGTASGAAPRLRWRPGWSCPLRPPDLFSLCLLRT